MAEEAMVSEETIPEGLAILDNSRGMYCRRDNGYSLDTIREETEREEDLAPGNGSFQPDTIDFTGRENS